MVINREFGIAYQPTPKNACSSIKHLMFYITNRFYFRPYMVHGKYVSIHEIHESYKRLKFERIAKQLKDYPFRFCVVREPMQRLRSAYYNKVIQQKLLVGTKFENRVGSFDDFLVNIKDLMANNWKPLPTCKLFLHHCRPQSYFLGMQPQRYTKIYNLAQLNMLQDDLSEITGLELALPAVNKSSTEYSHDEDQSTAEKHGARIEKLYRHDYRAYGEYF